MMNPSKQWAEIIEGFRGLRLAVHDDLANGNADMVNLEDLKTQEALGWLVYHRLVWNDGVRYVARGPREAREIWLKDGPAKDEAAGVGRQTTDDGGRSTVDGEQKTVDREQAGEPAAAAVRPRVHDYQPELFT